jgi:hypothetical protein
MLGQYIRSTDIQFIGKEDTFPRLKRGDLKAQTRREAKAAQDQTLQAKYQATRV